MQLEWWHWAVTGILLILSELAVPAFVLVWFGLGALLVESVPSGNAAAPGVRFKIGTGLSDAQRRDPPPVGSVVTYRYQGLTDAGVPRFASFVRVAMDRSEPVPK